MVREMSSQIVDVKKKPYFIRKLTKLMNFCTAMSCFFFFFLARLSRVQKKKTHSHDKILPSFFFSKTTDEQNRRRAQKSHRRADELEGPTFALLQSIYTSIYKPILRWVFFSYIFFYLFYFDWLIDCNWHVQIDSHSVTYYFGYLYDPRVDLKLERN